MRTDRLLRDMVPLNSKTPIPPRVPTRLSGKPKQAFLFERLVISQAGTANGTKDWIVNDLEVNGVSQLSVKDLPGTLFGMKGFASGAKASTRTLFSGVDVAEPDMEVAITVTYVGQHPEGVPFFGCLVGYEAPQRPTVLPIATRKITRVQVAIDAKNDELPRTTISAQLDVPLKIDTLEISAEGTAGGAADWIVHDLRFDGVSQFKDRGDVPGDMFSTSSIDTFVQFGSGKQIEIDITYIGLEPEGCRFAANLIGTVVRDNYKQPPPDIHAIVTVSGQDGSEEFVGHCDWREPYVEPDATCALSPGMAK